MTETELVNQHHNFMLLALECSRQALPDCRPNPPVGCVIVHQGRVVAKGFTQQPGQPHAEADALRNLAVPIEQCEIYVTLEPCSFHGRTPSCARTIASLKPRHVYIAIEDPHPQNQGKGIRILKQAGISCSLGIASREVSEFITPYLITETNY